MTNVESPVGSNNSLRESGATENFLSPEPASEAEPQFYSTPQAPAELLEDQVFFERVREFALEREREFARHRAAHSLPPGNDPKMSNHKGVYLRKRNGKFVARLCLPGKNRKLDLGEYNTHDEAARAYQAGAFYYNKSVDSSCEVDLAFLHSLPSVPDDLPDDKKLAWVRDRARQSAASIDMSSAWKLSVPVTACSPSFEVLPSTPVSYGTQTSCGDFYNSPTPDVTTPTTSGSAAPNNSFIWDPPMDFLDGEIFAPMSDNFVDLVNLTEAPGSSHHDFIATAYATASEIRKRRSPAAAHVSNEVPGCKRRKSWVRTRSHELRNYVNYNPSSPLSNPTPVADHLQAGSRFKMTDSILFASFELRKQGWEWTLKSRSASSAEAGVLFSVAQGQHAVSPALLMTDIILSSFHELREQGWEVHLEPSKCDQIEAGVPAAAEAMQPT